MTSPIQPFSSAQLEQLARELADTTTGAELDRLLAESHLPENEISTKWRRLRESFESTQRRDGGANGICRFICLVMAPARFGAEPARFQAHCEQLNITLRFSGLALREDGHLARVRAARTISEAQQRADSLHTKLRSRGVHPDVLSFCRVELLDQNYFHAILEATKSVAEKIRLRSGQQGDGAALIDAVFGMASGMPMLAFNKLETDTEKSEHAGLSMMIKGMFATFRNPTAHTPKVRWAVEEPEALDLLTLASMLHRRIDEAHLTPRAPTWQQAAVRVALPATHALASVSSGSSSVPAATAGPVLRPVGVESEGQF
jgi:uncharacterized protein (TIGR02391 family)